MKEGNLITWLVFAILMLVGNMIIAGVVTATSMWIIPAYNFVLCVLFILTNFVKWE